MSRVHCRGTHATSGFAATRQRLPGLWTSNLSVNLLGLLRRRETFQAFIAQDAHYLGTASTIYSQMLAKAPQGGQKAIAAIQDMLEDTQEEVSLHVGFAEARRHLLDDDVH